MSSFKIIATSGRARAGVLKLPHGEVKTPVFMPVGTQATVKALSPDDLKGVGAQIILGNTYHLYLRPGSKLIKKMGGLHKFMGWSGPILTDSGGFQAFSLGAMIEHGVKKIPNAKLQITNNHQIVIPAKAGIQKILKYPKGTSYTVAAQVQDDKNGSPIGSGMTPVNRELRTNNQIRVGQKVYNTKKGTIHRHVTVLLEKEKESRANWYKSEAPKVLSKITEDGVEFKSHLDGGKHLLTPEKSIEVQLDLGSDIILALDELLSPLHDKSYVGQSLERTHRWELRSLQYYRKHREKNVKKRGMIFGILQGVYDQKIRESEALWISQQDFDGYSIGGSFGTSEYWPSDAKAMEGLDWAASKAIYETMDWVTPLLPDSKPRHALGIGEVADFFECIERGVDMFDCVSPTRRARNGSLYISPKNGGKIGNKFTISIRNSQFTSDPRPIDPNCGCYTCQNFSRAYLKHLFISGEILYHRLATIHNVYFMLHLVDTIRQSIIDNKFKELKKKWL